MIRSKFRKCIYHTRVRAGSRAGGSLSVAEIHIGVRKVAVSVRARDKRGTTCCKEKQTRQRCRPVAAIRGRCVPRAGTRVSGSPPGHTCTRCALAGGSLRTRAGPKCLRPRAPSPFGAKPQLFSIQRFF
eukprot:2891411-Rhodomonas_salina.1